MSGKSAEVIARAFSYALQNNNSRAVIIAESSPHRVSMLKLAVQMLRDGHNTGFDIIPARAQIRLHNGSIIDFQSASYVSDRRY